MLALLPVIFITAFVSSAITLLLAYLLLKPLLKERGEQGIRLFIRRFKEEVGPIIEERVRKGVRDGVTSLVSKESLRDTTINMARSSVDFFGDTFKPLLKSRPKRNVPPGSENDAGN
jgi:hypothetical protein